MADEKTSLFASSNPAASSGAVDISKSDDAGGIVVKELPIDVKEIDPTSKGGAAVAAPAATGSGAASGSSGGGAARPHTPLPFPKPGKAAYFWLWFKYLITITIPTYSCYTLAHTASTVLSLTIHADTSGSFVGMYFCTTRYDTALHCTEY